jgi:hypothetical protein
MSTVGGIHISITKYKLGEFSKKNFIYKEEGNTN